MLLNFISNKRNLLAFLWSIPEYLRKALLISNLSETERRLEAIKLRTYWLY